MDGLISLCIPVHARTYDLKKTMLYLIEAANASPPVEILILDYNSPDDLEEYMGVVGSVAGVLLEGGSRVSYVKYSGRDHYHMAHARNLSVKASAGEYIVTLSADIFPSVDFVSVVREMLAEGDYVWMHGKRYTGAVVCERGEFVAAGGYDERFEFYGPEDTDLNARLTRRGGKMGRLPAGLLSVVKTPNEEKIRNYRLQLSKREMHQRMKAIYEENERNQIVVANEGKEWGQL